MATPPKKDAPKPTTASVAKPAPTPAAKPPAAARTAAPATHSKPTATTTPTAATLPTSTTTAAAGSGTGGANNSSKMSRREVPRDVVAQRAYELWKQRGESHGSDQDDWLRAEAELGSGSSGNH